MLHRLSPATDGSADGPASPDARSIVSSEFLLVCEAHSTSLTDGRWHFSIEAADGTPVLEAGDEEYGDLNRLTLLAAVRGLESLDGPSAVKLLSNNRYVIRSLSDSLPRWRRSGFVWEHFGRRIDIQHADLWRRVDRALAIHRVEACLLSSRLVSQGCDEVAVAMPAHAGSADTDGRILRSDSGHQSAGMKGPTRFVGSGLAGGQPTGGRARGSRPAARAGVAQQAGRFAEVGRGTSATRAADIPSGQNEAAEIDGLDHDSGGNVEDQGGGSDRLRRWLMTSESRTQVVQPRRQTEANVVEAK